MFLSLCFVICHFSSICSLLFQSFIRWSSTCFSVFLMSPPVCLYSLDGPTRWWADVAFTMVKPVHKHPAIWGTPVQGKPRAPKSRQNKKLTTNRHRHQIGIVGCREVWIMSVTTISSCFAYSHLTIRCQNTIFTWHRIYLLYSLCHLTPQTPMWSAPSIDSCRFFGSSDYIVLCRYSIDVLTFQFV